MFYIIKKKWLFLLEKEFQPMVSVFNEQIFVTFFMLTWYILIVVISHAALINLTCFIKEVIFFFFLVRESFNLWRSLMMISSLSLDQDINWFLNWILDLLFKIRDFTSRINWNPQVEVFTKPHKLWKSKNTPKPPAKWHNHIALQVIVHYTTWCSTICGFVIKKQHKLHHTISIY